MPNLVSPTEEDIFVSHQDNAYEKEMSPEKISPPTETQCAQPRLCSQSSDLTNHSSDVDR